HFPKKKPRSLAAGLFSDQTDRLAAAIGRLGETLGGAAGALVERGLATEAAFGTVAATEAAFALGTVTEAGTVAKAGARVAIATAETAFTGRALAERTGIALGTVAEGAIAL
ncbi:hypothetical protein LLE87_29020, partial [Paenibacillus polymyxa]|nr:hypothetical protein [Paenibacillus polymyxa]